MTDKMLAELQQSPIAIDHNKPSIFNLPVSEDVPDTGPKTKAETTPITFEPDKFIYTRKKRESGRNVTALTAEGKTYIKRYFNENILQKDSIDPFGHVIEDEFNSLINNIKSKYSHEVDGEIQLIPFSERNSEQKFWSLAVKSLEMHKRRLEDTDVEAFIKSSNSPWKSSIDAIHKSFKTKDGTKNKYSREVIANMLSPLVKQVIRTSSSIVDDGLIQERLARMVSEDISTTITSNLSDRVQISKLFKTKSHEEENPLKLALVTALEGKIPQNTIQEASQQQLFELLSEQSKIKAIQHRAYAQVEYVFQETYEERSAIQESRVQALRKVLNDPRIRQEWITREIAPRIQDLDNYEDIQAFLSTLDENAKSLIEKEMQKNITERPLNEVFGRSQEIARKRVGNLDLSAIINTKSPWEAANHLYDIYTRQGIPHEDAVLLITDEKWVRENTQLRQAFEQAKGYSADKYKLDSAKSKLSMVDKLRLKKMEKSFGYSITTLEDIEEIREKGENEKLPKYVRKLLDKFEEVTSEDYSQKRAEKIANTVNAVRAAFVLTPTISGVVQPFIEDNIIPTLEEKVFEPLDNLLHTEINRPLTLDDIVGVDIDGDGFADIFTTLKEAQQHATPSPDGNSHIYIDKDGDGIVDFDIATPTQQVSVTEEPAKEPEVYNEYLPYVSNNTEPDISEISQHPIKNSEPSITEEPSPTPDISNDTPTVKQEPQLSDEEWLQLVQEQELESNTNKEFSGQEILAPLVNPVMKARIQYCNDNPDWCQSFLSDEAKSFPGMVIWLIGKDDYEVESSRGDAILGLVFNANTGEVDTISLNRDIRVPGLEGRNNDNSLYGGATINTAFFVDQKSIAEEGIYREDPERAQRILSEATGLPADFVIEGGWKAFEDILSYLYGRDDGLIPVEVKKGNEFYTYVDELSEKAGPDNRFEAGTYYLTARELQIFLRERKGDVDGTFGREQRQEDFIMEALSDALSKNPAGIISLLTDAPSLLLKLEDTKGWLRTTSYLPDDFDIDKDGHPELYEYAYSVRDGINGQPGLTQSITYAITNHLSDFSKFIKNLVSNISDRQSIAPNKDESNPAKLVNDGQKFVIQGDGHKSIVGQQNPTNSQKLDYWEPLRNWVSSNVFGK